MAGNGGVTARIDVTGRPEDGSPNKGLTLMNYLLRAALFLCLALSGRTHAADVAWVQGSWVNVRSAAAADAPILGQWLINTRVQRVARGTDWCEARSDDGRQGFIKCVLLGERPLTLAEVSTRVYNAAGNPAAPYSPLRAFWIAPSVGRLAAAGQFLPGKLLSAQQRQLETGLDDQGNEIPERKLIRFAVPEFEAMKQLLIKGVVTRPEYEIQLTPLDQIREDPDGMQRSIGSVIKLLKQGALKAAQPSLFTRKGEVSMANGSIDTMAAVTGQPVSMRVLRGPRLVRDYEGWMADGFWDVGAVELTLQAPVYVHSLARNGLLGAASQTVMRMTPNAAYESCVSQTTFYGGAPAAATLLPDYPAVKNPLAGFYVAKPLPARKVTVFSRALRVNWKPLDMPERSDRVMLHEADLNADGRADVAVWEGPGWEQQDMLSWKASFLNIAGIWYLGAYDEIPECT